MMIHLGVAFAGPGRAASCRRRRPPTCRPITRRRPTPGSNAERAGPAGPAGARRTASRPKGSGTWPWRSWPTPATPPARGLMGMVSDDGPLAQARGRRRPRKADADLAANLAEYNARRARVARHRRRPVEAGPLVRREGAEGRGDRPLHGRRPARPQARGRLAAARLQEAQGSLDDRGAGRRRSAPTPRPSRRPTAAGSRLLEKWKATAGPASKRAEVEREMAARGRPPRRPLDLAGLRRRQGGRSGPGGPAARPGRRRRRPRRAWRCWPSPGPRPRCGPARDRDPPPPRPPRVRRAADRPAPRPPEIPRSSRSTGPAPRACCSSRGSGRTSGATIRCRSPASSHASSRHPLLQPDLWAGSSGCPSVPASEPGDGPPRRSAAQTTRGRPWTSSARRPGPTAGRGSRRFRPRLPLQRHAGSSRPSATSSSASRRPRSSDPPSWPGSRCSSDVAAVEADQQGDRRRQRRASSPSWTPPPARTSARTARPGRPGGPTSRATPTTRPGRGGSPSRRSSTPPRSGRDRSNHYDRPATPRLLRRRHRGPHPGRPPADRVDPGGGPAADPGHDDRRPGLPAGPGGLPQPARRRPCGSTSGARGPIVATGIHRFWVAGRGWVMARDLKPGDPIRTLGGLAPRRVGRGGEGPARLQPGSGRGRTTSSSGTPGALVHDNSLVLPVAAPFDAPATLGAEAR